MFCGITSSTMHRTGIVHMIRPSECALKMWPNAQQITMDFLTTISRKSETYPLFNSVSTRSVCQCSDLEHTSHIL